MSTKVGIITEGAIDRILLPPLLVAIAHQRAEFNWPVREDDISERLQIRGRGHGAVLSTARQLVAHLEDAALASELDHAGFVILLDRKTRPVQEEVRRLLLGRDRFVLGIAIEEIEAWWLADRTNTLQWMALGTDIKKSLRYAKAGYSAERDDDPKRTLSELTEESSRLTSVYGNGAVDLAREFVTDYWASDQVPLEVIGAACPEGFGSFVRDLENLFRRMKAKPHGKKPKKTRRRPDERERGDP